MTTPYHARYFASELTRQAQPGGADRWSTALFDACFDIYPYQTEAAIFALRSPLVVADEVVLGKTIEAGLVHGHGANQHMRHSVRSQDRDRALKWGHCGSSRQVQGRRRRWR